jgi:NADPH2:quinone reductase
MATTFTHRDLHRHPQIIPAAVTGVIRPVATPIWIAVTMNGSDVAWSSPAAVTRGPKVVLAVRIDVHGGPEVLRAVEMAEPDLRPGEVLVRHEVIGVNYVDTQHRTGAPYPVTLPLVPGIEAAGRVVGIGPGVALLASGDRVAYAGPMVGGYAELAAVPQEVLVPVPDELTSTAAAAALLQGMTAHMVSHDVYQGSAGERALVHAAGGGTGSLLVQFLLAQGVTVLGSTSSQRKAEYLREIGVQHVIDSGQVDLVEAVRVIAPAGVEVVFDSVGRTTFEASLQTVRPRGLVVAFGQSSGPVAPMDIARLSGLTGGGLPGSVWLTWPTLLDYNSNREALTRRAAAVFGAVLDGTISPAIAASLPLRDAARAHELLEGRGVVGKILLDA